jgi:hypothetical protein
MSDRVSKMFRSASAQVLRSMKVFIEVYIDNRSVFVIIYIDDSRGVIYKCNMFIVQAPDYCMKAPETSGMIH